MIYLDNAATTRMYDGAIKVMAQACEERWFNASALYKEASDESRRIKEAREKVSAALKAGDGDVYFLPAERRRITLRSCARERRKAAVS